MLEFPYQAFVGGLQADGKESLVRAMEGYRRIFKAPFVLREG